MMDRKWVRQALSLMMAAVLLCGGVLPGGAATAETETGTPEETGVPTMATTLPAEETVVPTVETTGSTEESAVPTEETTVPTEETSAPTEETTVPTEAVTAPTEETTVPTEETTASTEETTAPTEEVLLLASAEEAMADTGIQRYGSQETPMAASEMSVASLGSGSGVKFRIFNYTNGVDADGNYITAGGINDNGLDGYFNFRGTSYENTGADGTAVGNFTNSVTDIDGYTSNHATVLRNLGSDGYPVFDGSRDDGPQKSLGYLFGAGGKGVTGYTAANTLLRLNSKGQYYYNSADNAVDFDISTGRFIVRTYRERGKTTANQGSGQYYDFFPFTYWDGSTKAGDGTHWYNYNNTVEVDYWYGMTMEASFSMPEGGIVKVTDENGNVTYQDEMVFEFSGDDDVWVFIDNVLVLDLGGTHGVVSGSINFATGKVEQYLDWGGATSASTGTSYPTTLKAQFEKAGKEPNGGWNGSVFADYTEHTIKFYYLERATSCANCKILFNMPILPTGILTAQKQVEGTMTGLTADTDYRFALVQKTDSGETAAAGVRFDRIDTETGAVVDTGMTDAEGSFTLKAGQRAEFALTAGKTFLIRETDPGIYAEPVRCTVNGTEQEAADSTGGVTMDPNAPAAAVFTNRLKTTRFTVVKQVAGNLGDRDQRFSFAARLYSGGSMADPLPFPEPGAGAEYTVEEGEAVFQLKHGDGGITFDGIPIGAYAVLTEKAAEGYETEYRIGEAASQGTMVRLGVLTEPVQVVCINTREGVIETGIGLDAVPYGLMVTTAAAGLLFPGKRRRKKE